MKNSIKAIISYRFTTFIESEYNSNKFRLGVPKNYSSAEKKFPLVIYLHGAGERGYDNVKQLQGLKYLGNGYTLKARKFRKEYSSFVYVPQCPLSEDWTGRNLDNLIQTIEYLLKEYPIDHERLYLIGYSMGGSGSYSLSVEYYKKTGKSIAAIVRVAGQGTFNREAHEMISKSSIWFHIGLKDTPARVERVGEAYEQLRNILDVSENSEYNHIVDGETAVTRSLIIDKMDRVKLTEYVDMGHGISYLPFSEPDVLQWLFKQ